MSAKIVLDEAGIREELRWLYDNPDCVLAVDTETTGLRVGGDSHAIGVSIAAIADGHVCSIYVPIRHNAGWNASDKTLRMLRYVLETQQRTLIFANVVFDVLALESVGIAVERQHLYDICVMAHLIDENTPKSKRLEELAHHYLGVSSGKIDDPLVKTEMKLGFPTATYQQLWEYAVTDAELTWRVFHALLKQPRWAELPETFWDDQKGPLIRVLIAMRRRGVRIDRGLAADSIRQADKEMEEAQFVLGINPASPKQLAELMHGHLGIPVLHRTPTNKPKFDKVAMADYDELLEQVESPLGTELKRFRGWQKASSAAYKSYLNLVDSDGRLRCSYKMHGTVTGRLSCAEPNLQQIPKASDKPWNGRVKECFIAEEGYTLINADFSQLELRLATAYAQEPELVKVFAEGRDIFTEMSQQLGMTRFDTKTLVYSMQYGAGLTRLMSAFHVTRERAEEIRQNYYSTFPRFRALSEEATRKAEATMTTQLWSGRKRHYKFRSETFKAMNSLIQGGAADIMERIMVRCFELVDSDDCRMLLQVHDSITWEVRTELVEAMIPRIRAVMEDVDAVLGFEAGVRFAVDIEPWSKVEAAKLEQLAVAA